MIAIQKTESAAMSLLDDIVDDSPVLSPELARPKGVTKATVQRCISKLSPYRIVEQFDQVVELIQAQGPVGPMQMASQIMV